VCKEWASESSFQADGFQTVRYLGICDVAAVPGEQKVHSLGCGYGDMECIFNRFRGYQVAF
jgi:hypothetical protein